MPSARKQHGRWLYAGVALSVLAGWTLGLWAWLGLVAFWGVLLAVRAFQADRPGWVYFIHSPGADSVKIGVTQQDPATRMRALQTGSPFPLELLYSHQCDNPRQVEAWLHKALVDFRKSGEWFEAEPAMGAMWLLRASSGDFVPSHVERI